VRQGHLPDTFGVFTDKVRTTPHMEMLTELPGTDDRADLQVPNPRRQGRQKIWVDLDNSPHVPFFRPIIEELETRGYEVFVTARDAYQVRELLSYYGVKGRIIGKHYGKFKVSKALGTCWRALALSALVRKEKPVLAISHGSRGCLVTSNLLRIPSITLTDYEFVAKVPFAKPTWLMVPSVIPDDNLSLHGSRVLKYPGIKEDVYLSRFRPDSNLRKRLGIAQGEILVIVRPPATEAHYHNPESEVLLRAVLNRFLCDAETRLLLLPRNKRQEEELRSAWLEALASGKLLIPEQVEDGLNLIWNSDLVISGGGTMNREAAAMGVPVYSIFRGKIGAVDRYLADQGRLVLLETVKDVQTRIKSVHRSQSIYGSDGHVPALETIIENIVSILDAQMAR
jgi:predicted glycosyltransferase